ncbi:MAG TPA: hypothetical protein VL330_20055, partial [Actinomycetes bacterium]|nr:hypothetical protein [Actinomycetes bacterium]
MKFHSPSNQALTQPESLQVTQTYLWGAQSRSCSLPVLMKQTAKEVASAHGASVILAKNGQP